jgi:hypothetical protein
MKRNSNLKIPAAILKTRAYTLSAVECCRFRKLFLYSKRRMSLPPHSLLVFLEADCSHVGSSGDTNIEIVRNAAMDAEEHGLIVGWQGR